MKKKIRMLLLPILLGVFCLGSVPACALADAVGVSSDGQYTEFEETFSETVPGGLAIYATRPKFRTISLSRFPGSYGEQLDSEAKLVYDRMVGYYVSQGKTGTLALGNSVEFPFSGSGVIDQSSQYAAAKNDLSYAVISAYCAFLYDHPEIFWAYSLKYTWTLSGTKTGDSFSAKVTKVMVSFSETYDGATKDISAFNAAVNSAVNEISSKRTDTSNYATLKAIHDYVCDGLVYPSDYTISGKINPAYHSAAGLFLDVTKGYGVCECYAKSFAILCRKFDIPVALIVGDAGGAHMWNYVQVDGGNWYLVDATWDDRDPISNIYFLAGSTTEGFKGIVSSERTVYSYFSNSGPSQSFVVPVLSSKAYQVSASNCSHTWETVEERPGSCVEKGYSKYKCSICGETSEIYTSVQHQYQYVSNGDATCVSDGTKTQVCSVCGAKGATLTDAGTRKEHKFSYRANGDATCMEDGTKTQVCSVCQAEGATVTDVGSRIPHKFGEYVSNNDASYTKNGTKTAYCVYKCGTSDTIEDEGSMLVAAADTGNTAGTPGSAGAENTVTAPDPAGTGSTSGTSGAGTGTPDLTDTGNGTGSSDLSDAHDASSTAQGASSGISKADISSLVLQKNQSTSVLRVGKAIGGDYVRRIESLNKKLVKVTSNGKIKAKKNGTAKLRITFGSGAVMTVKVKVQAGTVKTKKILNVPKKLTLSRGASVKLSPELKPITSQQKLSYSSSNSKVVSVSSSGKLKARKKGKATITVKSGSKKAKCVVTVK